VEESGQLSEEILFGEKRHCGSYGYFASTIGNVSKGNGSGNILRNQG